MYERTPAFGNNFLFLRSDSLTKPLESFSLHIAYEPFGVSNSLFKYTYITRPRRREDRYEDRYETIPASEENGRMSNNCSFCGSI